MATAPNADANARSLRLGGRESPSTQASAMRAGATAAFSLLKSASTSAAVLHATLSHHGAVHREQSEKSRHQFTASDDVRDRFHVNGMDREAQARDQTS